MDTLYIKIRLSRCFVDTSSPQMFFLTQTKKQQNLANFTRKAVPSLRNSRCDTRHASLQEALNLLIAKFYRNILFNRIVVRGS